MSLDSSMAVIRVLTFVLPLTVSGLSNRTGRHFSSNEKRHSVTNIAEVDEFHFNKYPDFQLDDPIGAVRRVERVFGGFMKNTKTNIEGRIYVSYHNQHCQLRENQCNRIDIGYNYELPNNPYEENEVRAGRKIESDHATFFEVIEGLFAKVHLDGKSCVLRLICELAQSGGLPHNGLLGRALETLFLVDYGMSSEDRLYEYMRARITGEAGRDCSATYLHCPLSVFNYLEAGEDFEELSDN